MRHACNNRHAPYTVPSVLCMYMHRFNVPEERGQRPRPRGLPEGMGTCYAGEISIYTKGEKQDPDGNTDCTKDYMGLIFQDNSLQSMRRLRAGAGVNPGDLEPWAEGVLLLCCL
ncbi:hypothetical protein I7I53_10387 [Histoplasma capsulatum var. duboisii H88]|uniref:Uncharacterized protein n=1 Tax=Ajellomyces capsulatus (strain H88) TaxID=544711 RepID=A0A8A1LDM5_AJEC8|nr:hypothetical protein I7I53_10387 [Histoplasma capsulatum var. duboisii H88]